MIEKIDASMRPKISYIVIMYIFTFTCALQVLLFVFTPAFFPIWSFANSFPPASSLLSHDSYQQGRVKANTCVL